MSIEKKKADDFLLLAASQSSRPAIQGDMAPKAAAKKFDGELVEKVKKILLLKGRTSSQVMNDVLKDLALISKPNAKALQRKNDIIPFEDAHSLEFLGPRNECGLFALASHSKKRPDNLTIVSRLLLLLSRLGSFMRHSLHLSISPFLSSFL